MSNVTTLRTAAIGMTALLIVGCNSSPPPVAPSLPAAPSAEVEQVTLYLANMNKDLKIL